MRNIIKKLLSLLLVGVVAVSMFVFITPIHVNATEANALDKGILCIQNNGSRGEYYVGFCDNLFKPFLTQERIVLRRDTSHKIPIPKCNKDGKDINFVVIETNTPVPTSDKPRDEYRRYIFKVNRRLPSKPGEPAILCHRGLDNNVNIKCLTERYFMIRSERIIEDID